ncbi:MAG TPA: HEAT repeat domain-containing protein [Ktedonobacteraceae bacterium]|nr:HEAT repeat domain-containing protein [Ktedonobacteraceae bacterium]
MESLDSTQQGYLGSTPLPDTPPERGKRAWVDRPEQLLHAVNVLSQASVVAVDAEFTQVRSRTQVDNATTSQRLALLQLAIEHECFVVDALRLHDLSLLKEVVENPAIVILLHGAGADLRVMADRDLNVLHYYDLEAASRSIFGQHESSLAAMLQRALHVRLDKSLQRTDWSRRPLPPAMVAYAARDAEMTLALYHWLAKHYSWALQLHDYTTTFEPVAAWIEPFLRGTSSLSAEAAVAEAKTQGIILDNAQIVGDCRAALAALTHPMHRSRLLRLIADLSLTEMAADIESLLHSPTSDERSASVRALGRLGIKDAQPLIRPLLQDPVQDVRKSAQTALRSLSNTPLRAYTTPVIKLADGARSWTVGETESSDEDDDWKARLRSIME